MVGEEGEKWKTDEVDKCLVAHGQVARPQGGRGRLPRMQRPELKPDCNQQDFTFFTEEWRRLSEGSSNTDDKVLRDKLLSCAEPTPRKTLNNILSKERLTAISTQELLTKMQRTAVKKCSLLRSAHCSSEAL